MSLRRGSRAGYSLIEVLLGAALMIVVVAKVSMSISSTATATGQQSVEIVLEDQARSLMDRIALAVMAADRESLNPYDTPFYTTDLNYRISLGVDAEGNVVWDEPERILLDGDGRQIAWLKSPDELAEKRVVWTNLVRALLQGEADNDLDDNGNGLLDEEGLNFIIDGNSVLIRLSLSRMGDDGERAICTLESRVTCRN
jgi:hypothetical protein